MQLDFSQNRWVHLHTLTRSNEGPEGLRAQFPGGATSATPVTDLNWGAWKRAWPDNRRDMLEKLVKNGTDEVNFQAYQELAGRFVRGTTEERTKLIFNMRNAQIIKASELLGERFVLIFLQRKDKSSTDLKDQNYIPHCT